jgi:hypothetical protein
LSIATFITSAKLLPVIVAMQANAQSWGVVCSTRLKTGLISWAVLVVDVEDAMHISIEGVNVARSRTPARRWRQTKTVAWDLEFLELSDATGSWPDVNSRGRCGAKGIERGLSAQLIDHSCSIATLYHNYISLMITNNFVR